MIRINSNQTHLGTDIRGVWIKVLVVDLRVQIVQILEQALVDFHGIACVTQVAS